MAVLMAFGRSSSLWSPLFVIFLLAFLFCSSSAIYLIRWLVKNDMRKTLMLPYAGEHTPHLPERRAIMRRAERLLLAVMATAAACTSGYLWRDHQLVVQSQTYWDVAILDKYSDSSFRIQPARMQDGQWDFCAPTSFQKNEQLRYITFEQKNGCKRLEYFQKLDPRLGEKLDAAISFR